MAAGIHLSACAVAPGNHIASCIDISKLHIFVTLWNGVHINFA